MENKNQSSFITEINNQTKKQHLIAAFLSGYGRGFLNINVSAAKDVDNGKILCYNIINKKSMDFNYLIF